MIGLYTTVLTAIYQLVVSEDFQGNLYGLVMEQ